MSGFTRLRGKPTLMLGLALMLAPTVLHAQTAEERIREQELKQRLQERLQAVQEERLARIEEAMARAKAHIADMEHRHGELDAAQIEDLERMYAEAMVQAEQAQAHQEEALVRQFQLQAENLARAEEARSRYADVRAEYMLQAEEARARVRDQVREAQQVMVQVRSRIRLGVTLQESQEDEYDSRGARIQSVLEGTPAEEAGLEDGDIITHLNGQSLLDPIPNEADEEFDDEKSLPVQRLMALAQDLDAGDEVEVRYLRDGASETVSFEAADMDDPSTFTILRGDKAFGRIFMSDPEKSGTWTFSLPDDEDFDFEFRGLEELEALEKLKFEMKDLEMDAPNIRFRSAPGGMVRGWTARGGDAPFILMSGMAGHGLDLTEMKPDLAEYFSVEGGLLVLDVDEDSTLGLLAGDVILAIDGRAVEDQRDFLRILGSYEDEEKVSFTIMRKGREMSVDGNVH